MEEQKAGAGLTTGDRYLVQLLDYLRLWELGKDGGVHQPVITDYEGQLAKMYLYLTFSCPNRCWFCYADGGRRTCSELSPGDFARIVRQGVEAGFESVVLLGGEPLVYSGFSQLIREIQSIDRGKTQIVLRSSLSMPLGDELLVQICNTFDRIVTSIDGNEERHDSIRGKGRYACTLDNLRRGIVLGKAEFSVNSVMSAAVTNWESPGSRSSPLSPSEGHRIIRAGVCTGRKRMIRSGSKARSCLKPPAVWDITCISSRTEKHIPAMPGVRRSISWAICPGNRWRSCFHAGNCWRS